MQHTAKPASNKFPEPNHSVGGRDKLPAATSASGYLVRYTQDLGRGEIGIDINRCA